MSRIIEVAKAAGLALAKRGDRYVTACVFHTENTPSLYLTPKIDAFHCFGCDAKGGYVDLAKQLGVDLNAVLGPLPRQQVTKRAERPVVPAKAPPAVQVEDLPTRTTDVNVLRYIERRGWSGAMDLGILRFPTADAPRVKWGGRQVTAFEKGYRLGALLLDMDGKRSGLQLRRVTDEEPRFYTLGSGAFGTRARIATARRVYLVEGLGDYLAAVQAFDARGHPVIGLPGADTAAGLLGPCTFPRGAEALIMFDPDDAGDKAARVVAALVRRSGGIPLRAVPELPAAPEADHG